MMWESPPGAGRIAPGWVTWRKLRVTPPAVSVSRLPFPRSILPPSRTPRAMFANRTDAVPLPLALHLASYTLIGLFCAFAGGLNLIDPGHILRLGVPLLVSAGFTCGYVFCVLLRRNHLL